MNRRGFLAAAAALSLPLPALAEAWPSRPVRVIIPYPPGGGTDLVSRTILPAWTAAFGQQIVIDNRGGAQGLLGTALGAKATPDGYTLTIAEIGAVAVMPGMTPKVQFDALKDFAPISQLIEQPYIMAVHSSVPVKTLAEFVQFAKSKAGSLNSLSSGPPGDQPAKNNFPSAVTGEEQGPDGMPATNHLSAPVFRS